MFQCDPSSVQLLESHLELREYQKPILSDPALLDILREEGLTVKAKFTYLKVFGVKCHFDLAAWYGNVLKS